MKNKILRLFCVLLAMAPLKAYSQILEMVDMSVPGFGSFNTYLTGINNSGYVTGYFNNGFNNIGFIITPTGKRLTVNSSQTGFPDSRAESINDNGVAVLTCNNGSTVGIFKCYLDTLGDSISHYVQVTGISQPSSVAFDINNNNDMSGWFQSNYRYLWVKHDSIVPTGNIPFESDVFQTAGPNFFNTMAGGINDANKVAGFYIDGTNVEPYVYNNITEVFDLLAITNKCRLWDINNNNIVCGEFLQLNNVYMAFTANVSTGNFTQFTSLKTIFDDSTIQSVANGINDQGVVVGSFFHPDPNVNVWVGFIYRPGTNELRIPGFAYNTGTWALSNNTGVSNTVWPSTYWSNFNYTQTDPYVNNGSPMFDNFLQNANPGITSIPNASSIDWPSFCKEVDIFNFGSTTNPYLQQYYHNVAKHILFDKYKVKFKPYNGHCYGLTYTQLLHHFDDALFSQWFNIQPGTNISQVANTDNDAIQAIARSYFRQNDIPTLAKYSTGGCYHNETMWSGLHEMKMEFSKPFSESNPRSMSFELASGGYHSVLPYKIRTPRTLPFDYPSLELDTVYIHDSNNPQDSLRYFTVSSYGYNVPHHEAWYINGTATNYISFNKISVRELMNIPYTQFKSTAAGDDPYITIATDGPSYYDISTTGGVAESNGGGYTNNSPELLALEYETQIADPPVGHLMDTAHTAALHTYNYTNNAMIWKQSGKMFSMGVSRNAVSAESDNGEVELRRISYGNPDATTKYLACSYSEVDGSQQQGVSILATQVCADPGDSIVTRSPSPFVYEISKITGTANCLYELTIFAAYNGDSVMEFHSAVTLNGIATHTIDPYFNGTEIGVVVDNGNDGIPDDTLFVAGWPVGVEQGINKGSIKVYPNPVQDELNIEFAQAGTYNIVLTDVVGRTVYTSTVTAASNTQLSLAKYPTGVYLLQVADSKGNSLLKDKIIKQ